MGSAVERARPTRVEARACLGARSACCRLSPASRTSRSGQAHPEEVARHQAVLGQGGAGCVRPGGEGGGAEERPVGQVGGGEGQAERAGEVDQVAIARRDRAVLAQQGAQVGVGRAAHGVHQVEPPPVVEGRQRPADEQVGEGALQVAEGGGDRAGVERLAELVEGEQPRVLAGQVDQVLALPGDDLAGPAQPGHRARPVLEAALELQPERLQPDAVDVEPEQRAERGLVGGGREQQGELGRRVATQGVVGPAAQAGHLEVQLPEAHHHLGEQGEQGQHLARLVDEAGRARQPAQPEQAGVEQGLVAGGGAAGDDQGERPGGGRPPHRVLDRHRQVGGVGVAEVDRAVEPGPELGGGQAEAGRVGRDVAHLDLQVTPGRWGRWRRAARSGRRSRPRTAPRRGRRRR